MPQQRKGRIAYGYRMVKGRLVEYKAEQDVIMLLTGQSYGVLACWLKVNQVKTKS